MKGVVVWLGMPPATALTPTDRLPRRVHLILVRFMFDQLLRSQRLQPGRTFDRLRSDGEGGVVCSRADADDVSFEDDITFSRKEPELIFKLSPLGDNVVGDGFPPSCSLS